MSMTDVANAPASDTAMIALLPITTDWCRQDLPHMTLAYAGLIADLKPTDFNELAKDAGSLAILTNPLTLRVLGLEVFGDTEKVDVLLLEPTSELLAMRRAVEGWDQSDFPFRPHVTIGPTGQVNNNVPRYLAFDRLYVGWGNECLTFLMKNGSSRLSYVDPSNY